MNLVIDIGNTRTKAAVFNDGTLTEKHSFKDAGALTQYLAGKTFAHCLISSVSTDTSVILPLLPVDGKKIQLTTSLGFPIRISYDTPDTLGVDRIAAACGAYQLFPREDCLVIDMGTCITYDFLSSDGVYEGGAIAPGVKMRFSAMNHFTARLPKVEPVPNPPLTGKSTVASMQSGVINGVLGEINDFISRYQSQYANMKTVACGGDLTLFENSLKPSIFVAPDLVLIGLNRILLHHVND
ncbi:MAG TPA: type III pantothenate kinase [Cyclobacteriaceae bacterium]|nr:type III pantothenate kinase [Cyclobacteriaceae bacterium]